MNSRLKHLVNETILRKPILSQANSELTYLKYFDTAVSEEMYKEISESLIFGGWTRFIRQYFYGSPKMSDPLYSPIVIFPGNEFAATRVEPIPLVFQNSLTLGDILFHTAWIRGLTPSLLLLDSTVNREGDVILQFRSRESILPHRVNHPPAVGLVDKMLIQEAYRLDASQESYPSGRTFFDLIHDLTTKAEAFLPFNNKIKIDPRIQNSTLNLTYSSQSLTEFLNLLAYKTNSVWEWGDAPWELESLNTLPETTICFFPNPFVGGYIDNTQHCHGD